MILHPMCYSKSAPGKCSECLNAITKATRATFRDGTTVFLCADCLDEVAVLMTGGVIPEPGKDCR